MSPTRHLNSTDSQSDSEESKTDLILPDDLPIDLRVKIVVCLIYLRNLHPIKVNFFLHFSLPATETRISSGHVFNFPVSLEAEENLNCLVAKESGCGGITGLPCHPTLVNF